MPKKNTEEQYDVALVIRMTGYGNRAHQRKQAATIRRSLVVSMHRDVEVFMAPNLTSKSTKLIPVTWDALKPGQGSA